MIIWQLFNIRSIRLKWRVCRAVRGLEVRFHPSTSKVDEFAVNIDLNRLPIPPNKLPRDWIPPFFLSPHQNITAKTCLLNCCSVRPISEPHCFPQLIRGMDSAYFSHGLFHRLFSGCYSSIGGFV